MSERISDLGDLERAVLEVVWAQGPVSANVVQKRLGRPLKESTVRTVLTRLERKGYLRHTTRDRTFIYGAAVSRSTAAARAVKRIIDRFCNGSVEEVLTGMVDARIVDRRELHRLAEKIAASRGGSKS